MTCRTPSASVAKARSMRTYSVGMCMRFVWEAIASPKSYGIADANAGWERSKGWRHGPGLTKDGYQNPPAGTPVYWSGGKHGHVALSVGGGKVRSTDWPKKGQVGETTIAQLTKSWGLHYRGWSTRFAQDDIPGVAD